MKRLITQQLLDWKIKKRRKPLLVRGARQVGKTWAILDFGSNHMEGKVLLIDLEKRPSWRRVFDGDLDPRRLLSELEILLETRITPGRDLLFLDEIQACPRALTALRYFYEELPELHVAAAGSLLDFSLGEASLPVGRIQFLEVHPMCFVEYLWACGREMAAETVLKKPTKLPANIHHDLLEEARRYFFIGGMPESVKSYTETGSLKECFEIQFELIHALRQDFSKYAGHSDKRCLNAVLSSTACNIGRQIKYSGLSEDFTPPTNRKAFYLLNQARILRKVRAASAKGLPLEASSSERIFKALLVDIGLMQHLCGLPANREYAKGDLLDIHEGAMAEQFVGQELLAGGQSDLFYWSRRARSSSAEVDYLISSSSGVLPIEVKSGPSGRLRSLHMLLQTYPDCSHGIVLSCGEYAELPERRILFLPLYYAFQIASANPALF